MSAIDSFERRLDDKNRLTIPAELRQELDDGEIVLTRGFGDYIHMYSTDIWDSEVEPALQGAILDETVADLNVRFRRGKSTAKLDSKQGRVTIDQSLLDYAGIDREVIAVRAGKYWRIMSPEAAESM
jgi:MraZ protein